MAARERLIQIYLSNLAAAQVCVVSSPAGAKIVRQVTDEASYIGWCDPRAVDVIIDLAGAAHADVDTAERALLRAAEQVGVELRSDAEMQAAAVVAVDRVEGEFKRALKAGELRVLNSRYREYRLAQNAAGKPALSYSRFMWNERVGLVKKTAQLVASSSRMSAKLQAAIAGRQPSPTVAA